MSSPPGQLPAGSRQAMLQDSSSPLRSTSSIVDRSGAISLPSSPQALSVPGVTSSVDGLLGSRTGEVIAKIEGIFESIVDDLADGTKELSIPYRSRSRGALQIQNDSKSLDEPPTGTSGSQSSSAAGRVRDVVTFPGKTVHEAKKFAALMRILELSLGALTSGSILTKRDLQTASAGISLNKTRNIYYQNTNLFRDQRVVDELVDGLAFTLGVSRGALNIVAASKGLVIGPVSFILRDGSNTSCALQPGNGTLIPHTGNMDQIKVEPSTRWIVVIEKEATFRTLASLSYWRSSTRGRGIIITAKGYPDLDTRAFLNLVHRERPLIPIYCLVDFDPDGIAIFRTYKYGSQRPSHEENSAISSVRWLGIKSGDLFQSERINEAAGELVTHTSNETAVVKNRQLSTNDDHSLGALTNRDRRTALGILRAICAKPNIDDEEIEQLREVQTMMFLNMKAEIQAVDTMGDISDWLDEKMMNRHR